MGKSSKAGNLKIHFKEHVLGKKIIPLYFSMEGGMYLAEKYGSISEALSLFDTELGDKDKMKLSPLQINLITDLVFSCSMGSFSDALEVRKLLTFSTMSGLLAKIKMAIKDNYPQDDEEEGNTNSPPETP